MTPTNIHRLVPAFRAGLCVSGSGHRHWWLLITDGLYHSTAAGPTLNKILDQQGAL